MRSIVPVLMKAHRWLALAITPFFLLILLSGMVLAFKPVVEGGVGVQTDIPQLLSALKTADPQGRAASFSLAADGQHFTLRSRGSGPAGVFDAHTGLKSGEAGFNLFDFARRVHENLLVDANSVVTVVTAFSVLILLSGFFLKWRPLRNTLSGWHTGLGWLAWPLAALTPVTGLLMALHMGMPRLPDYEAGRPQSIVQSIEIASQHESLQGLTAARNFRKGAVMVSVQSAGHTTQYLVPSNGDFIATSGEGWVRMLHQGNWSGAVSGLFTLGSTFPLLGLVLTGAWKWWQRTRRQSMAV